MYMYMYLYMYLYIYMCVYTCIHLYIYLSTYLYIYLSIYIYIYIYIHISICKCVCVRTFVYIPVKWTNSRIRRLGLKRAVGPFVPISEVPQAGIEKDRPRCFLRVRATGSVLRWGPCSASVWFQGLSGYSHLAVLDFVVQILQRLSGNEPGFTRLAHNPV